MRPPIGARPPGRRTWASAAIGLTFVAAFFVVQHDLWFTLVPAESFIHLPEEQMDSIEEGSRDRQAALLCLGLVCALTLVVPGRHRLGINGVLGWALVYHVVWAGLSLAWTVNAALTLRRLAAFAILLLAGVAMARRFAFRDLIVWLCASSGFYVLLGVAVEVALGTFQPLSAAYRFAGTLHPNFQGPNCALLVLACLAAAHITGRRSRLAMVGLAVGVVFLLLTRSRTACASALGAALFYEGLVLSRTRVRTLVIMACGAAALSFGLLLLQPYWQGVECGVMLAREDSDPSTLTGRIKVWRALLEHVQKRPIEGYGYGAFWTLGRTRQVQGTVGWGVSAGHSAYVDLLLATGVVGAACYIVVLTAGITASASAYRTSGDAASAFCGGLLVYSLLSGLLESGCILTTMQAFVTLMALAYLGLVQHARVPAWAAALSLRPAVRPPLPVERRWPAR
ncbi:MAG: O-antigen ligase family protein [Candidatus Latescibacterota bacterium]